MSVNFVWTAVQIYTCKSLLGFVPDTFGKLVKCWNVFCAVNWSSEVRATTGCFLLIHVWTRQLCSPHLQSDKFAQCQAKWTEFRQLPGRMALRVFVRCVVLLYLQVRTETVACSSVVVLRSTLDVWNRTIAFTTILEGSDVLVDQSIQPLGGRNLTDDVCLAIWSIDSTPCVCVFFFFPANENSLAQAQRLSTRRLLTWSCYCNSDIAPKLRSFWGKFSFLK